MDSLSTDQQHHVVTGAAGFIGSHLVDGLLAAGCLVTGIDDLSRGSLANLTDASRAPQFALLTADLAAMPACNQAFDIAARRGPVRVVWHMAANSDIGAGVEDPLVDHRNTFLTTLYTLLAMRERGIKQFAFASSSAIYGELDVALSEDTGPLFPISSYGAMKLAAEGVISAALESHLERAWIFRFPNVIGPRATHGVIFDLLHKIAAKPQGPLEVLGDGTQRKPYLHVNDLLEAMLFIVETTRQRLNYFNIAGVDEGATVAFIAESVIAEAAPHLAIAYTGGQKGWVGDVTRVRYATGKIRALGWRPALSSEEAVRRAVREIHEQLTCKQSS